LGESACLCTAHRSVTAKMEINKAAPGNPIIQDVKAGAPRFYPMPLTVGYGAIPRTYEHPGEVDDITGLAGDGDPVDVVDISSQPLPTTAVGAIVACRVVGGLAMVDDEAADWKVVVVRLDDPLDAVLADVANITRTRHVDLHLTADGAGNVGASRQAPAQPPTTPPDQQPVLLQRAAEQLAAVRAFFATYKKRRPTDPSEPSPVTFAFDGDYVDAATAMAVVRHHHIHWCNVVEAVAVGKRVSMLHPRMQGYQTACDDARERWAASLAGQETRGASAGAAHAIDVPPGVWLGEMAA